MVVVIRVVTQRLIPVVLSTMVIPQLLLFDVPVVRVVQFLPSRSHPRCVQRQVPWLRLQGAEADSYSVSPVAGGYGGRRPIMQVVQISLRGTEADSHGPDFSSDHRVLLHKVIDVPVCRSCRSFTSLLMRRNGFPRNRLVSDQRDSLFH